MPYLTTRAFALSLLFAVFMMQPHSPCTAAEPDSAARKLQFELLPATRLVPIFTADQRAHRLSVQGIFRKDSAEFIASMGGIFPVFNIRLGQRTLQFSAASTLYTTLKRSIDAGDLINTDFFVDLMADLELNRHFTLRLGAGHTSQHLSDDALKKFTNLTSINYVRDYYQLFGIYRSEPYKAMIYAGVYYNHNFKVTDAMNVQSDISGKPLFQLGLEHSPFSIGKKGAFYYAADIKFRGEFNYRTTQNVQAGVKFSNESKRAFRTAFNYASGYEERGQFYTQKINIITFGLYFDF